MNISTRNALDKYITVNNALVRVYDVPLREHYVYCIISPSGRSISISACALTLSVQLRQTKFGF